MSPLRLLPIALACLTLAALALSYAGRWFPPGDSLAVGRPHLSGTLILISLWLSRVQALKLAFVCLLAGALGSVTLARYYLPGTDPPGAYSLYQKNLLFKAWPRYPLADEIIASRADIVTLQEVSAHNQRYMKRLFEAYPTQLICPSDSGIGVALLTHHMPIPGTAECTPDGRLALMQIDLPKGQPLWIAALHLHWPWPFAQADQLRRILPRLERLQGPVVLAGDFNMVPWAAALNRIAQATKTTRIGPARDTFPHYRPYVSMPIDHILLPKGSTGRTQLRDLQGSDHHGLFVEFDLPSP